MATPSPVPNNKVGGPTITPAAINGSTTPQCLISLDPPKTNQRGHNKPKCIKCGNVARSRCPFQSCKNCCAKAQNPCHIHVLKQSSTLPAQSPPSTTPVPEQPSSDAPSTGALWRLSSLRRLSHAFASSMRVNKPLTRKEALNINKWRFSKLKEHIEGNIETENEAFNRYMWNIGLLEETFATEELTPNGQTSTEPNSSEVEFHKLVSSMKTKLRSNTQETAKCRERIRDLVHLLLRKLKEKDLVLDEDELNACKDPKRSKREGEWIAKRIEAFNDLIDKLSKVRSEDDLRSCLDMKLHLLNHSEKKAVDLSGDQESKQETNSLLDLSEYSIPKRCTVVDIDEEVLSNIIDVEFSAVGQLAEL